MSEPREKRAFSSPKNSAYHAGTLLKGGQKQVCLKSGLKGPPPPASSHVLVSKIRPFHIVVDPASSHMLVSKIWPFHIFSFVVA